MTLDEQHKEEFILFRINCAKEAASDAEFLIKNKRLRTAVNRIYYAMFYMLMALALKFKFKTSKHQQLISWFNKQFIKNSEIPVKYSKIIQKAYKNRTAGDYDDMIDFSADEVDLMQQEMREFIQYIENYIKGHE